MSLFNPNPKEMSKFKYYIRNRGGEHTNDDLERYGPFPIFRIRCEVNEAKELGRFYLSELTDREICEYIDLDVEMYRTDDIDVILNYVTKLKNAIPEKITNPCKYKITVQSSTMGNEDNQYSDNFIWCFVTNVPGDLCSINTIPAERVEKENKPDN